MDKETAFKQALEQAPSARLHGYWIHSRAMFEAGALYALTQQSSAATSGRKHAPSDRDSYAAEFGAAVQEMKAVMEPGMQRLRHLILRLQQLADDPPWPD